MTLARILVKLWALRIWVAVGLLPAGVAAVGSVTMTHSTVYSIASTQMLVDSPSAGLASGGPDNAETAMTGLASQASVFARLMTSAAALQYIGQAAGIPGSEIAATGPFETNGSAAASHTPTEIKDGKDLPFPSIYSLSLVQNPDLPTVDVYAQAPTTAQAIALANGAVTGFAKFVASLDGNEVPASQNIAIRQLGAATGGAVDPSATKEMALLIFVGIFVAWCGLVLFVSRLRAQLRAAKASGGEEPLAFPAEPFTTDHAAVMSTPPSFSNHPSHFVPTGDVRRNSPHEPPLREPSTNGNGHRTAPAVAGRRLVRTPSALRTDRSRPEYPIDDTQDPSEPRSGTPYEGDVDDELRA